MSQTIWENSKSSQITQLVIFILNLATKFTSVKGMLIWTQNIILATFPNLYLEFWILTATLYPY